MIGRPPGAWPSSPPPSRPDGSPLPPPSPSSPLGPGIICIFTQALKFSHDFILAGSGDPKLLKCNINFPPYDLYLLDQVAKLHTIIIKLSSLVQYRFEQCTFLFLVNYFILNKRLSSDFMTLFLMYRSLMFSVRWN